MSEKVVIIFQRRQKDEDCASGAKQSEFLARFRPADPPRAEGADGARRDLYPRALGERLREYCRNGKGDETEEISSASFELRG